MSATCPACGVAVVPGYVRCPKCQAPLPGRRVQTVAGGTAVEGGGGGRLPLLPIAGGAVVLLGLILYFVLGKSDAKPASATEPVAGSAAEEAAEETDTTSPAPVAVVPDDDADPNRIDPNATARDLERALKSQRLWSSVEVVGKDVYVTSGSCRDANMIPMVDAARAALRNAGLTRLRCMENSGAVVFERGL
jgi:hypothetical protein